MPIGEHPSATPGATARGRELVESRCEEVVKRSDGDRHLPLQADRLACGGQSVLKESIEALPFVPDFDDSEANIDWGGQMEIDAALGSCLHP
jgi:hypothetical protein